MRENLNDRESRRRRYSRHLAGVIKRKKQDEECDNQRVPGACKKDESSDGEEGNSFTQDTSDDDHNYESQSQLLSHLRQRKIFPVAREESKHKEKTIVPKAVFSLVVIL